MFSDAFGQAEISQSAINVKGVEIVLYLWAHGTV
jgi:hypothetical protein